MPLLNPIGSVGAAGPIKGVGPQISSVATATRATLKGVSKAVSNKGAKEIAKTAGKATVKLTTKTAKVLAKHHEAVGAVVQGLFSSYKSGEYLDAARSLESGQTPALFDNTINYVNELASLDTLASTSGPNFKIFNNDNEREHGPTWGDNYSPRGVTPAFYHQLAVNRTTERSTKPLSDLLGVSPSGKKERKWLKDHSTGTLSPRAPASIATASEARETYVVHAPRSGVVDGKKVSVLPIDVKLHGVINMTGGWGASLGLTTNTDQNANRGTGEPKAFSAVPVEAGIETGYTINAIYNPDSQKFELPTKERADGSLGIDTDNINFFTKVNGLTGLIGEAKGGVNFQKDFRRPQASGAYGNLNFVLPNVAKKWTWNAGGDGLKAAKSVFGAQLGSKMVAGIAAGLLSYRSQSQKAQEVANTLTNSALLDLASSGLAAFAVDQSNPADKEVSTLEAFMIAGTQGEATLGKPGVPRVSFDGEPKTLKKPPSSAAVKDLQGLAGFTTWALWDHNAGNWASEEQLTTPRSSVVLGENTVIPSEILTDRRLGAPVIHPSLVSHIVAQSKPVNSAGTISEITQDPLNSWTPGDPRVQLLKIGTTESEEPAYIINRFNRSGFIDKSERFRQEDGQWKTADGIHNERLVPFTPDLYESPYAAQSVYSKLGSGVGAGFWQNGEWENNDWSTNTKIAEFKNGYAKVERTHENGLYWGSRYDQYKVTFHNDDGTKISGPTKEFWHYQNEDRTEFTDPTTVFRSA
ncbi:hypothetical protein CS022_20850 [Veronia nyctiphanis]|uniref:Uncharacterized protein n=2 Tax=Veronia nyctiphanis TaxID=1278244 RepID=A0A4Q0YLH7_9GAMM|nr:hypothetical protein CS022_20850 [Veronia nyctiphanis]